MHDKIDKYIQGELSDTEKASLFDKLDSDVEAKEEFTRIHNTWGISELISHEGDDSVAREGLIRLQKRIRKNPTRQIILNTLKYAAIIAIAVLSSWYLFQNYTEKSYPELYTEIEVPMGQRVHITLADSTSVWLSPHTRIKIPNNFSHESRIVELDGEGFFAVTEDKERPFIVKSKGYNIQVLGTRFNVFSYSQSPKFETSLVEGMVHVYKESNPMDSVYLSPNEKAWLMNDMLQRTVSGYQNEEFLGSGIFNFQSVPFIDILDYLALWYDVKFKVGGSVLLSTKVSGKFRQSDEVENILLALQGVFKFKFKQIDNSNFEIYN